MPRVTRLVATHPPDSERHITSSIYVYYQGAVPEAVIVAASSTDKSPPSQANGSPQNVDCPWMVRINSPTLLMHLSMVLNVPMTTLPDPLVMMHPFKILAAYADKLASQPHGAPAKSEKENLILDLFPRAKEDGGSSADHLRCLQEILTIDFQPLISLRRSLSEAQVTRISSKDLWHLFRPGDLVVSKHDGHEQLYRVLEAQQTLDGEDQRVQRPRYARYITRRRRVSSDSEYSESESSEGEEDEASAFWVFCLYLDFDGTSIGPVSQRIPIHYFPGEKEITSLPLFPAKFVSSDNKLQDRLAARGKRFLTCQGHMKYDGMTTRPYRSKGATTELQGEIYVDVKTGYRAIGGKYKPVVTRSRIEELFDRRDNDPMVYDDMPPPRPRRDRGTPSIDHTFIDKSLALWAMEAHSEALNTITIEDAAGLSPELCQLLPYRLLAYAFQARKWYFVDIDCVHAIDKSESALQNSFNDLVIPETYRDLLVALVQNHTSEKGQKSSMDLVQGKGRGLFILLHGPPGVGKTSTAELIAAYTRRPLYSITCGDIGLTPRQIERKLSKHFSLANRWGCVLLLDEADVFLMKRDWRDMNRNALVSVFLRVLEYYSGILFLTTNRIGVIDEAFKSRVHICLRYPTISLESTRSIWENQLNRISRENADKKVKIIFNKAELFGFADKHYKHHAASGTTWNGRQIRNAFQTAIALGHHDRAAKLRENGMTEEEAEATGKEKYMAIKLTRANFKKIAKTAKDFEDYMVSVRGSDTVLAQEEALRDDGFEPNNMVPAQKDYLGLLSVSSARRARSGIGLPHGPAGGSLYADNRDDSEGDSDDDY
ncbi:P-loop containing nucleoside triphosphate hydrolase protein [Aspergillus granulosus]|uniref:P-loop containing nucleoside triphosphate hydrolase protein n=1 Tax=Aspergillus granulosus TaxID=176169 RepID=A0ABR4GTN8_9EURO